MLLHKLHNPTWTVTPIGPRQPLSPSRSKKGQEEKASPWPQHHAGFRTTGAVTGSRAAQPSVSPVLQTLQYCHATKPKTSTLLKALFPFDAAPGLVSFSPVTGSVQRVPQANERAQPPQTIVFLCNSTNILSCIEMQIGIPPANGSFGRIVKYRSASLNQTILYFTALFGHHSKIFKNIEC